MLLAKWAKSLTPRQALVVALRVDGATYKECGEELGCGIERARQITLRAFENMRRQARCDGVFSIKDAL